MHGGEATNHDAVLLSLGSVNADFQVRVSRRPQVSETLLGTDFERFAGGKAANVALCAQRLGVPARLFGRVGTDDLAAQALGPLRQAGVDLDGVVQVADRGTGVAMITVPPDGKKGIVLAPNANAAWTAADAERIGDSITGAPAGSVLVLDCEVAPEVVHRAMAAAGEAGFQVVLDPSPADRVTDDLIAATTFIVPNAGEAEHLTGIACEDPASAREAGRRLLDRGADVACVKLPDGGCVIVESGAEAPTWIDKVPVDVVDTTGAGDAFAGAFGAALVERRGLVDTVKRAVAASHWVIAGYGSQAPLPDAKALEQMSSKLRVHRDSDAGG